MGYSVGKSSFGELAGVVQEVATAEISNQVASLCYEFDTQVAQNGDRLTVNEGIRSRPRQKMLRDAWETYQRDRHPWAALAAVIYTSTHDQSRGSALDFGITRKDGSNRALTQAEFDWVHANGVRRGIRWTGAGFRPVEQWHHNGGYPATVPPIPGVIRPGEPLPGPTPESQKPEPIGDDDMPRFTRVNQPGHAKNGLVSFAFPTHVRDTSTDAEIYEIGRAYGLIPANGKWQEHVEDIAYGEYERLVEITRDGRAAIAANVWAHTFRSGNIAGVLLDSLLNFPKKVWQYRFNSGAQSGATLQKQNPSVPADADQASNPKD